jgi:hypothetical protein
MKYARLYADDAGEPHFEDVEVELTPTNYAPPAPPVSLSALAPATAVAFMAAPPGWDSDWHPTPRRQMVFYLAGEVEIEASDGSGRRGAAIRAGRRHAPARTPQARATAAGSWARPGRCSPWCSWPTDRAGQAAVPMTNASSDRLGHGL